MTLWMGKLEVSIKQARPRPHQGRHHRLPARAGHLLLGRPGRGRRRLLHRRRLLRRLAADPRQPGGDATLPSCARPRPGADDAREGAGRPGLHARLRVHAVPKRAGGGGQGHGLQGDDGAHPRQHGPEVRPGLHLRALPAVRRHRAPTTRPSGIRDPRIWTAERDQKCGTRCSRSEPSTSGLPYPASYPKTNNFRRSLSWHIVKYPR